jgi:hypothetical protein
VDKMLLSFFIITSLLPASLQSAAMFDADEDTKIDVQKEPALLPKLRAPAVRDVDGCTATRKYRLGRDHSCGACGVSHLHLLEK